VGVWSSRGARRFLCTRDPSHFCIYRRAGLRPCTQSRMCLFASEMLALHIVACSTFTNAIDQTIPLRDILERFLELTHVLRHRGFDFILALVRVCTAAFIQRSSALVHCVLRLAFAVLVVHCVCVNWYRIVSCPWPSDCRHGGCCVEGLWESRALEKERAQHLMFVSDVDVISCGLRFPGQEDAIWRQIDCRSAPAPRLSQKGRASTML